MQIEHKIPLGFVGKGGIRAAVIAHSVSAVSGKPIVTFLIDFPRFILPEFNTHRCLIGSTELTFDLPSGSSSGGKRTDKRAHYLTLENFYRKWSKGSLEHTTPRLRPLDFSSFDLDLVYTAKELSTIFDVSVSNIRTACRKGTLKSLNPIKLRNADFKILGSDFKTFREMECKRTYNLQPRLKVMRLRSYNEKTKKVEHTKVTDCWYVGERETLKVTTETGETLTGTLDHLVLTDKGWKELKDVTTQDSLIKTCREVEVKKDPQRLKRIDGQWVQTWNRKTLPILTKQQGKKCYTCQEVKPLEIHHVVPVHVDNSKAFDIDNVIAVCEYCHKNVHHKTQGWQEGIELSTKLTKIVSITLTGVQKVYDLSVESEFHNFFANGLVVHNCLSRNGASSRAIPVAKSIEAIQNHSYMPIHFGQNKAGMTADNEVDKDTKRMAKFEWDIAASNAIGSARKLDNFKIHKQVTNRVLEPFSYMRMVVTATEWDNFFWLRLHEDADPHINELARVMLFALQESVPTTLQHGDYHVPFFGEGYWTPAIEARYGVTTQQAIEHSMSCCAQTSYRKLDMSSEKTQDIVAKLFGGSRSHCFSSDTEVLTLEGFKLFKDITPDDLVADVDINTCQVVGFVKPLDYIQGKHTGVMFEVNSHDLDFKVTSNHTMLGHALKTMVERHNIPSYKPFKFTDKAHTRSPKDFMFECPFKLPTAPVPSSEGLELDPLGQLIGMYIGDGCKDKRQMRFHFKKTRKVQYLQNILNKLGLDYTVKQGCKIKETVRIAVRANPLLEVIFQTCGTSSSTKRIGVWDINLYPSIFDGLKNSDGSVTGKTWSYSTTSEELNQDFLSYAPLAGLTASSNKMQKGTYKIMIKTTNFGLINDSRMIQTKVKVLNVVDEPIYCLTMPSGALITRRNGKTLVTGNSSPAEHIASPMAVPTLSLTPKEYLIADYIQVMPEATHLDRQGNFWSNNFKHWSQYRDSIEGNVKTSGFDYDQDVGTCEVSDMFEGI